ncbi:hypothetical protein ABI59_07615 [Acidobacteria bacterium Mor1]|nr:hypothetical protein ABI59_07615 [Acidobacteria bacterium Mor1]
MSKRFWIVVVSALLIAGLAGTPAVAKKKSKGSQPEVEEPAITGPAGQMQADLRALAGQIKNAGMKVKHVLGAAEGKGDSRLRSNNSDEQMMSVLECCTNNVQAMRKRMDSFVVAMRVVFDEAKRTNDEQSLAILGQMASEIREMNRAYEAFAGARGSFHAEKTLSTLRGTYKNLRDSLEDYIECCAGVRT